MKYLKLFEQVDWDNDPFGEEIYIGGAPFEIGDKVICIKNKSLFKMELKIGKKYTISNIRQSQTSLDGIRFWLVSVDEYKNVWYLYDRFKKVE